MSDHDYDGYDDFDAEPGDRRLGCLTMIGFSFGFWGLGVILWRAFVR